MPRGKIISTKYKPHRYHCPVNCQSRYRGLELDKAGKVLRTFDCKTHCKGRR